MSDQRYGEGLCEDMTFAVLQRRKITEDGPVFTGDVIAALIPKERLDVLIDDIDETSSALMVAKKHRLQLLTQGNIQHKASGCTSCKLCMVCAGRHYTYSREFNQHWPPGQEKCFVNLVKGGKPLQTKPCKLCDGHDRMRRDAEQQRRRAITKESGLKQTLFTHHIRRQQLFDEFAVEFHPFQE